MRTSSSISAIVLVTIFLCAVTQAAHSRPTPLKVVLYPFVPAKDAYFRQIETDFEKKNPQIDLQIIDLSDNYYNEDEPLAVTNTAADVIELDSAFIEDFISEKKIRVLSKKFSRPTGTYLEAAEKVITRDGKVYGVPHWVCTNFLFSTLLDPINVNTLKDLIQEIGINHKSDRGLLIDLKGRSTLGEWYLDALLDRYKNFENSAAFIDDKAMDISTTAALTTIRSLCDSDLCRNDRYHEANGFYPVQFGRHRGRALAGYSERLYYIGTEDISNCRENECVTLAEIKIDSLPLSDAGSQPFVWVDSFVIGSSCNGRCGEAAEIFLRFMSDANNVRKTLTPGYGEAPRYLLPALQSLYAKTDPLNLVAPLYQNLYPLIINAIPIRSPGLNRKLRAVGRSLDKTILPN